MCPNASTRSAAGTSADKAAETVMGSASGSAMPTRRGDRRATRSARSCGEKPLTGSIGSAWDLKYSVTGLPIRSEINSTGPSRPSRAAAGPPIGMYPVSHR